MVVQIGGPEPTRGSPFYGASDALPMEGIHVFEIG
jgi:hypothetical protein